MLTMKRDRADDKIIIEMDERTADALVEFIHDFAYGKAYPLTLLHDFVVEDYDEWTDR